MNKLKKTITGTGIAILLAISGMTGEYYINPDVDLLGEKYTGYEYSQIREQIGEKAYLNDENNTMSYKEIKLFVAVLNKEKNKYNNKIHPFTDAKNILKDYEVKGCPK